MTTAAIIGCTGLVGSHILTAALVSDAFSAVYTISRRAPESAASQASAKLHPLVDRETSNWPARLRTLLLVASGAGAEADAPDESTGATSSPAVVFSALGTTREQAGGIAEQWKIDHDANVQLCEAARRGGTSVFVFVSSGGTRSMLFGLAPYARMKVGVENAVMAAGFPGAAIILRPGLLLGDRGVGRRRGGDGVMSSAAGLVGRLLGQRAHDAIAQDSEVVAHAAVRAAEIALRGEAPSKVWVLEAKDIVKLGRPGGVNAD